ncbi:MAG: hemolysin, partial [Bacteroidaceae bacterium]|nr:hemolysin [Bacteroidaceae bacterium]
MEEIIDRVPREAILAELTPEKKLRRTNKSGNDIYIVTA